MVTWGEWQVSTESCVKHFLAIGSTGSGKTLLIKRLVSSALNNGRSRMMIYDPKQEWLPTLSALGQWDRTIIMHPFDERGFAWNMAADICDPVSARQLATILVPDNIGGESGGSLFYRSAVRDLFTAALIAFIKGCPKEQMWTFRDVLLTLLYPGYLNEVVKWNDRSGKPISELRRLKQAYLDGGTETTKNIIASLNASLMIYEPVAACWAQAARQVSLEEWVRGDKILVLGNDESARAAIDAINQAIVKRVSELLLAKESLSHSDPLIRNKLSWVVLDELREAGKLDGVPALLTKGRSKGVCMVLGFQDIDGLKDVYGEYAANELVSQCQNIAILRLNSGSTAEWASALFGRGLNLEKSPTSTMSSEGRHQFGEQASRQEQATVYTRDFLEMPEVTPASGICAVFKSSDSKPIMRRMSMEQFLASEKPQPIERGPFIRRDSGQYYLRLWDKADWARLGFEGDPPSSDLSEGRNESVEETLKRYRL